MTIIHDALDLIVQSPTPVPLLMTSGSQDWTPFRSCSLLTTSLYRPPLVLTSGGWLPKQVQWASG